jgi:hypothetical protein
VLDEIADMDVEELDELDDVEVGELVEVDVDVPDVVEIVV